MKQLYKKITKKHLIVICGLLTGFLLISKCNHNRTQKYNQIQMESMEKTLDSINLVYKDSIKTLNFELRKVEDDRMNLFNQLDLCYESKNQIFEANKNNSELKKSIENLKKEIKDNK